jgi:hypothetical protein
MKHFIDVKLLEWSHDWTNSLSQDEFQSRAVLNFRILLLEYPVGEIKRQGEEEEAMLKFSTSAHMNVGMVRPSLAYCFQYIARQYFSDMFDHRT